ncbi:MAG: HAMP domain-containing histidine kinase [Coriobacteriales bacterium]|nr:HAMP domain-containing histidine kinase [Coriobacteriales bacterium]
MRGSLRSRLGLTLGAFGTIGALIGAAFTWAFGIRSLEVAAVMALLAIGAIVLGRIAARNTTAPLERLAAAATSFASGDHSVRVEIDGPREVRIVAEAFNRMAEEADSAMSELRAEERRKSQFVSDVSHELRTPLTAIRGAAETLLDGDVDPDDEQRFLGTIATEAERLSRLANDLLTLQRIEGATGELPIRRIDLRVAADRAAALLEPLLEDRRVEVEVRGHAPAVLGDLDRVQQVVANLVDNASRVVGEGGRVRVELSAEGDDSILAVLDDGPGIAQEDLDRLFDRFYKSDPSRGRSGGAGLGLAIVKAIVTAHGGTISARNLPDGGSAFVVRLPSIPE